MQNLNRRSFLKAAGLATAETMVAPGIFALTEAQEESARPVSANDHIQLALI
jgi:hypothetical protein